MKKKLLFFFLCSICGIAIFVLMVSHEDIRCYEKATESDILPEFEWELNGLVLNSRQACAVESAAKMNPKMNVYLLFISDSKISNHSREIFNQLKAYPNIRIGHIHPERYMQDTPLELWYKSGILKQSKWPKSHMSDILRYLTLWKYGGIYLDLDVVVTKCLEHLTNFAGAEDWGHVAAGVLGFDVTELGRRMADACIRDIRSNFRGDIWGNNGPGVITRTLQKICSTQHVQDMTAARCGGFKVFPPSIFYPVHYSNWKSYFDSNNKDAIMKTLEDAMAIHVWNKLSQNEKVDVNSDVPYATIARRHCPKIFNITSITENYFK